MGVVTKTTVMYRPLIKHFVFIKYHNITSLYGTIIFETKNTLHINTPSLKNSSNHSSDDSNTVKIILKSGINELFIYDTIHEKFVQINLNLIQNTLISRLKKMK